MVSLRDIILCGVLCLSFQYIFSYDLDMLDISFELCSRISVHREARCFALCTENLASEMRWQT